MNQGLEVRTGHSDFDTKGVVLPKTVMVAMRSCREWAPNEIGPRMSVMTVNSTIDRTSLGIGKGEVETINDGASVVQNPGNEKPTESRWPRAGGRGRQPRFNVADCRDKTPVTSTCPQTLP